MSHHITLHRASPDQEALVRDITLAAYAKWLPRLGRAPLPMTADYGKALRDHLIDLMYVDDEVVGLIEMVAKPDHLLIENVCVDPNQQGKRYGRRLMTHAENVARRHHVPAIKLYTNKLFHENISFYQILGYQIEREEPFMGGALVHFIKRL